MRAKWPGRCTRTGLHIRVGDDIQADGRGGWELPATDPRLQPAPAPAPIHRVGLSSASHWRRAQARRSSTIEE